MPSAARLRASCASLALFLLIAFPYFLRLDSYTLRGGNEVYNVEPPREMLELHRFLVPAFNYEDFFDKPALGFWLVMPFYALLGVSEWVARLPVALLGLALAAVTRRIGVEWFGRRAAWPVMAAAGLSPYAFSMARLLTVDEVFAVALALSFLGFGRLLCVDVRDPSPAPDKLPRGRAASAVNAPRSALDFGLAYGGLGLAALAKGPLGFMPVLVTIGALIAAREYRGVSRLRLGPGLALALMVAAPWYLAVTISRGAEFARFFFLHQYVGSLLGAWGTHRGLDYYPSVIATLMLPWSPLLAPATVGVRRVWRAVPVQRLPLALTVGWLLVPFVVFSAAASKRETYLLALYPAVALLAGAWLAGALGTPARPRLAGMLAGIGFVAIVCAAVALPWLNPYKPDRAFAGAIRREAGNRPYEAGAFAYNGNNLVFYLRHRVENAESLEALAAFLDRPGLRFAVIDRRDLDSLRMRVGRPLEEVARGPWLALQWKVFRGGTVHPREFLLVAAR